MKISYVVGTYNKRVLIPKKVIKNLPSHICLFLTAQFMPQQEYLIKQLVDAGLKVDIVKTRHTFYKGQIYGCSTLKIEETDAEAFFFIGDGLFHPTALLFDNDKRVYAYNPITNEDKIYDRREVSKLLQRRKGAYVKFLSSKKIGILVTTKVGQNRMAMAEQLIKEYPKKDFYLFLAETLDFDQLENYPYIEIFVNTMCPRIGLDDIRRTRKMIINMEDVSSLKF